jgi:transcriptional regulator GlxA family with amidase domain
VRSVEQYVAKNLRRQVPIDELALAAGVSVRTLARRVHAVLGMTPHELVQRFRVSRATHLPETSHVSVEEVASRVGYADSAAFRRVFRRYAGDSPRRHRGAYLEDDGRPEAPSKL